MKYLQKWHKNDVVMTPDNIANAMVRHFQPQGSILEPCKGTGAFLKHLPEYTEWCEISEGRDFYEYTGHVDWIITNPPWSHFRSFLHKSLAVSNNAVFLIPIAHFWFKARLRIIEEAGFQIKEICLLDSPKEFPQMGFQLGAVHVKKDYSGDIKFTKLLL